MAGDITEIKRALAQRAQSVCEMLLPAGKREGNEWRIGSLAGEPGQSLGVHLKGQKAGVWMDFSDTGEWGDLIDLWSKVKGIKLAAAIEEARKFLGMERQQPFRDVKKTYKRPPKPKGVAPQARVLDYLRENRNIPAEIITKFRVGENGDSIVFLFPRADGTLALVKERKAIDGSRPIPTSTEAEKVLFGWQAMPDDARECVITEGEIDALSWAAYGQNTFSVPFGGGGGGKQDWIENEYDNLERFETIYLALDNDEQGDVAAAEIASRLGRHRCKRVTMPHKDANECLVAGVSREEMELALLNATSLDPAGLHAPSHFADKVTKLFWPDGGVEPGCRLPYDKIGGKLIFRGGELTAWQGETGAGKSQLLSDCIVDWVHQGERVCLSSLEMVPEQTLRRMCKQAGGVDRPTEEFIHRILKWLDGGLLIYGRVGKSGIVQMLEVFDYARAKYGCTQFVIDSFMRLGISQDDYNAQEAALEKLASWVISNRTHVHLVTHSRKPGKDATGPQETADIKGGQEVGANAFNVIAVWRNKKLEKQIVEEENEDALKLLMEKPGVVVNVSKQRNGDWEGTIGLWFDKVTYRYRSSHDNPRGRDYVMEIEREAA